MFSAYSQCFQVAQEPIHHIVFQKPKGYRRPISKEFSEGFVIVNKKRGLDCNPVHDCIKFVLGAGQKRSTFAQRRAK